VNLAAMWSTKRPERTIGVLNRGIGPGGHASITMTLDRYSHWIPSMRRHAADGMDEALG
jgi:hypothetical protein